MSATILTVTTTDDRNDGNLTDGLSLREAILIANNSPDTEYEILLTGGLTYTLTANGIDEDGGKTGDLDIVARSNILTIKTSNGEKATIDASGLLNSDRVFHVLEGGKSNLENLIITGGGATGTNRFEIDGGGGIRADETASVEVSNSIITGNTASGFSGGGGIYNRGFFNLQNSTVSENIADGRELGDNGGGILNSDFGTLIVVNTNISNNQALDGGAGIFNFETATLINVTINGNDGGGLESNDGSVALINTTVSGNQTETDAAGIELSGGSLNLLNSTVTENKTIERSSITQAAGIFNFDSTIELKNSIVAGNTVGNRPSDLATFQDEALFLGNNNNIVGEFGEARGTIGTGSDIIAIDPLVSPLQDNGGFTLTHIPLDGSPAIDAGNNSLIPVDGEDLDGDGNTTEQISLDQRDFARISNGTVDIGSVEFGSTQVPTSPPPPTPTPNLSLDIDGSGGQPSFARDGLLISAYLFYYQANRTDYSVLDRFNLDPNATRKTGNEINDFLKDQLTGLDVDSSGGQPSFARDGLLISAYLFYYQANRTDYSVLDRFNLDPNAIRKTGNEIAAYLQNFIGSNNVGNSFSSQTATTDIWNAIESPNNDFI
jgi:hypothetical protein